MSVTDRLNPRQSAFCSFYEDSGNAADAARRAGYSEHSARRQGHRLLGDDNIQQHIATLKNIRARARAMDREILMARLDDLYEEAMRHNRLNAAIQALRLMAQIGGHTRRGERIEEMTPEEILLFDPEVVGPVQTASRRRAARDGDAAREIADETEVLVANARLTLARTRPDPPPPGATVRSSMIMGTAAARRELAAHRRRFGDAPLAAPVDPPPPDPRFERDA
jgi:phage terminase small subunit